MYEKCFYFLLYKFKFLWKNGVSEKIKAHLPQQHPALQQLFAPTFLISFKKIVGPTPTERGQRLCILYDRLQRRDNKVITILYDRFYIYKPVKS